MSASSVLLLQLTCLFVASKFDEIDDNITRLKDLRMYAKQYMLSASNQTRASTTYSRFDMSSSS